MTHATYQPWCKAIGVIYRQDRFLKEKKSGFFLESKTSCTRLPWVCILASPIWSSYMYMYIGLAYLEFVQVHVYCLRLSGSRLLPLPIWSSYIYMYLEFIYLEFVHVHAYWPRLSGVRTFSCILPSGVRLLPSPIPAEMVENGNILFIYDFWRWIQ